MDFMFNEDGDLDFSNGDFRVDNNDLGHIESIMLAQKGEWKQFPLIGVGISSFLNSPLTTMVRVNLEKEIKLQLKSDLFKNIFVQVKEDGTVDVNANKDE